MSLEIKGTIVAVLPLQTGEGKNGTWSKQTAVLETAGQYPKKVAFEMWKDKIKELKIGDTVNIGFDIESREYEGKWYTNNVGVWKVEVDVNVPSVPQDAPAPASTDAPVPVEGANDLPFSGGSQ